MAIAYREAPRQIRYWRISLLNHVASDKSIAKLFFKIYAREFQVKIAGTGGGGFSDELASFINAHKSLDRVTKVGYMSAIVAATFLCGAKGVKHRALLADIYAREVRPFTAMKAIEESRTLSPALAAASA